MAKTKFSPKDFLERYKINDRQYLIGVYEPTITFYKQQIRTTNLFYSLLKEKIISEHSRIAVIGGGIAGLTFAGLALKCGMTVGLYEKDDRYLQMQAGCTIRPIHPNVYDWPVKTLQECSETPVLNWKAGKADTVVDEIVQKFYRIKNDYTANFIPDLLPTTVNSVVSHPHKVTVTGMQSTQKGKSQSIINYDIAILAVGYGLEFGVAEASTVGYWRNDQLSQAYLFDDKNFHISGTGDGGLTDLFRIKIKSFDIIDIHRLLTNTSTYDKIYKAATLIREKWIKGNSNGKTISKKEWLFEEFEAIESLFDEFKSKLIIHENIVVTLYGREPDFGGVLNLNKASFINTLLAFILFKKGDLFYNEGVCTYSNKKLRFNKKNPPKNFYPRHGTQLDTVNSLVDKKILKRLKVIQQTYAGEPTSRYWDDKFLRSHFVSPLPTITITSATKSFCLNFMNNLFIALKSSHPQLKNYDFRLALHRVIRYNGEAFFQQLTPYVGSEQPKREGSFGKINRISYGIVGLAIRTGKPFLIFHRDEHEVTKLVKLLNLRPSYTSERKTFLAIPIVAQYPIMATNLVLFLDSNSDSILENNPQLIPKIFSMLSSFVQNVKRGLKNKEFIMKPVQLIPTQIDIHNNFCAQFPDSLNVFQLEMLKDGIDLALQFKEFLSFDMDNTS